MGAASASAQTEVGPEGNRLGSTIETGETLQISLRPPDNGSTGYHWRVAKRPRRSVLRLQSNQTIANRQVFTYRARGAGVTSLRLQYVSPGRRPRVRRTFRHNVVVNRPVPTLDCNGGSRSISLIAQSATARVFKIRRTIRLYSRGARGGTTKRTYDVFLGCAFAENRTHELGARNVGTGQATAGPEAARNELYNLTLRGTVVGYAFLSSCPFEVTESGINCTSEPAPYIAAQDLNGGRLIRSAFPESYAADAYHSITGLVVSPTGGLAWTEVRPADQPITFVRRSDGPPDQGETAADDVETLDEGSDIDPNSLLFDGTNVEWRKDGRVQRARLR